MPAAIVTDPERELRIAAELAAARGRVACLQLPSSDQLSHHPRDPVRTAGLLPPSARPLIAFRALPGGS